MYGGSTMKDLVPPLSDVRAKLAQVYDGVRRSAPEQVEEWGEREVYDGGMSNRVWETEDGDVGKLMDPVPKTALFTAAGNRMYGDPGYPSLDDRMANEEDVAEDFEALTWFDTPEVLETAGNALRMERMEGMMFKDWAVDADPRAVYRVGYRTGSDLRRYHEAGGALIDARTSNMKVDEGTPAAPSKPEFLEQDPSLAWMDFEYGTGDASETDRDLDMLTLVNSARHLDPERYGEFMEGVEDGYGVEVTDRIHAIANVTSKVHARYLEDRPEWEANAERNVEEVDGGVYDLLDRGVDAAIAADRGARSAYSRARDALR